MEFLTLSKIGHSNNIKRQCKTYTTNYIVVGVWLYIIKKGREIFQKFWSHIMMKHTCYPTICLAVFIVRLYAHGLLLRAIS